jgi:ABC-type dipeptide/oligopeptide/nickel transport system permease component
MISAFKRYSFADVLVTLSTSILVALPVFWLGMLLQQLFAIQFKKWGLPYLPASGMSGRKPDWEYLILPAITLAAVSTAYAARIMRSQLLEVMGQDYVRTATAKGLAPRAVIWRHEMKNAMIPVVTFLGLDLGTMMSGAILTETIFNWPGVGYEIYISIQRRDWPVVMGGVILVVVVVMIVNLLVDISYAFLDPRIRYGSEKT